VVLQGTRLNGRYLIVRFKRAGEHDWLIFRPKD